MDLSLQVFNNRTHNHLVFGFKLFFHILNVQFISPYVIVGDGRSCIMKYENPIIIELY